MGRVERSRQIIQGLLLVAALLVSLPCPPKAGCHQDEALPSTGNQHQGPGVYDLALDPDGDDGLPASWPALPSPDHDSRVFFGSIEAGPAFRVISSQRARAPPQRLS